MFNFLNSIIEKIKNDLKKYWGDLKLIFTSVNIVLKFFNSLGSSIIFINVTESSISYNGCFGAPYRIDSMVFLFIHFFANNNTCSFFLDTTTTRHNVVE